MTLSGHSWPTGKTMRPSYYVNLLRCAFRRKFVWTTNEKANPAERREWKAAGITIFMAVIGTYGHSF